MKYLFLLLFLVGCDKESTTVMRSQSTDCVTKEDRERLAVFIVECAKAANPMSDEEGEDLVAQCESSGKNTLCPSVETCQTVYDPGGFMSHKQYRGWGPCK